MHNYTITHMYTHKHKYIYKHTYISQVQIRIYMYMYLHLQDKTDTTQNKSTKKPIQENVPNFRNESENVSLGRHYHSGQEEVLPLSYKVCENMWAKLSVNGRGNCQISFIVNNATTVHVL